ncbi:unannotated protein [freshwater metagenome]|uniref:Unannotated protein n=1 Tax=freshwater metagenome TaxID=449393 RepID=A0A6J6QRW4_9ZZZZ
MTSTLFPMRRIATLNGNTFDHQTSWPCVRATILTTPALRKVGARRPSGAAAPKHAVVAPNSRASFPTLRATRGLGRSIFPGSRTTLTPNCESHCSSYPWAPSCADVYTTTLPLGSLSIRPIIKVSIPPARGPKSFVTNSVVATSESSRCYKS